jgi:hypothetical protein
MLETGNMVKIGIDEVQTATVLTGLELIEINKKVNDPSNLIIDMVIQINEQKEGLHQLNNNFDAQVGNINSWFEKLYNNLGENEGNVEVMIRNSMNELRNRMEKGCIKEISDDIHAGIIN